MNYAKKSPGKTCGNFFPGDGDAGKERQFYLPHCGYTDSTFHAVCPECGRPYFRDYIDTRVQPRDPNPQGVYRGKTWARIFLVLTLVCLAVGVLVSFHLL